MERTQRARLRRPLQAGCRTGGVHLRNERAVEASWLPHRFVLGRLFWFVRRSVQFVCVFVVVVMAG
jgi:hypothetical protein